MDESDLRVGGWKKPRRITLLRLLGLLLVLALALLLIGCLLYTSPKPTRLRRI